MYPNILGKKYVNITTGKTESVTEQDGEIVTLDGNNKVSIVRLMDKNVYDDFIDPATFFQTAKTLDLLSSKIMAMPDEILAQMPLDSGREGTSSSINEAFTNANSNFYPQSNESMIIQDDPDEEMRLLQEKVRLMGGSSPINQAKQQSERILSLIDDNEENYPDLGIAPALNKSDINSPTTVVMRESVAPTTDPILVMFDGVKRNVDFDITINISKLIPRLDFIEMMEDSYKQSIIDYLANEFTCELLENPEQIKAMIKAKIVDMVYPNKNKANTTTKTTKPSTIKSNVAKTKTVRQTVAKKSPTREAVSKAVAKPTTATKSQPKVDKNNNESV